MISFLTDITVDGVALWVVLLICVGVFLGAFMDAIAGGGGIITVPTYLMGLSNLPIYNALGTNKLSSGIGTIFSTARFIHQGLVDWRLFAPAVILSLTGSVCGTWLQHHTPAVVLKYLLLVVLPVVAFITLRTRKWPDETAPLDPWLRRLIIWGSAFVIGGYDGYYGPGTGTFMMIALVRFAKLDTRHAAGGVKVINLASNIGGVCSALMAGTVVLGVGLAAALASILGHYLGAGLAIRNGSKIVRPAVVVVLLLLLVVDENNIRRISEQKELNEHMLMETRMRILENRTYMELRHLVHDLKSPLTSMQALVGVVKLSAGRRGDQTEGEYLERIETMIDRMSSMISEILHEEQRSVVTTQELLDAVMAQISSAEYADLVHTENRAPEAKIRINKIRFSRVLINLVENAAYAVRRPDGKIWIRVEETEGAEIRFQVEDNGTGIPRELLGEIWEKGFSIRSSSGLGLNFVQQVVEQCGGSVELESVEREGTVVTVSLPPCEEDVCETGPV